MKMLKCPRTVLTVAMASILAGGASQGETEAEKRAPLSEVSGVLHKNEKSVEPFLVLDGSKERCYVRGKLLERIEQGARIRAKGVLRSYLFDATATDWKRTDAPAPPPFLKGWVVYLDVKEVSVIQEPFGERSKQIKISYAPRAGSDTDAASRIWRSPDSSLQQRADAVMTLIPKGTSKEEVQTLLGRKGIWTHYHGPSFDAVRNQPLPDHDYWRLVFEFPDGGVSLEFEPATGFGDRFVRAAPFQTLTSVPLTNAP